MRKRQNYAWRNEMTSDHFSFAAATFQRRGVLLLKYERQIQFRPGFDPDRYTVRAHGPGPTTGREAAPAVANAAAQPLGQPEGRGAGEGESSASKGHGGSRRLGGARGAQAIAPGVTRR